jgi:hypothetical protein
MNRVDCSKCHEILDAEWDGGEVSEQDRAAREEHMRDCSACRQYQSEMKLVLDTAATLKDVQYERPVELSPLMLRPHTSRPFLAGVLATSGVAVAFVIGLFAGGVLKNEHAAGPEVQMVRLVVPMAQANRVEVVGDFTGWKNRIALNPTEDGMWVGEVRVAPGRYKYMIVVDDAALQPDPAAREVVDDGFGGKNSVLDVGSI